MTENSQLPQADKAPMFGTLTVRADQVPPMLDLLGLIDRVQPLQGENFRSFLGRALKRLPCIPFIDNKRAHRFLLAHFRAAGLDVNLPADACMQAVRVERFNKAAPTPEALLAEVVPMRKAAK